MMTIWKRRALAAEGHRDLLQRDLDLVRAELATLRTLARAVLVELSDAADSVEGEAFDRACDALRAALRGGK